MQGWETDIYIYIYIYIYKERVSVVSGVVEVRGLWGTAKLPLPSEERILKHCHAQQRV